MKFLRACAVLAGKRNQSFSTVLSREKDNESVYLELRLDGWAWNRAAQDWTIVPLHPEPTYNTKLTRLHADIRVLSNADEIEARVAADYLKDMLEESGAEIYRVSDFHPNRTGQGGRIYIEVGL